VGGWRPAQGAGKHAHLNGGSGLSSTAGGFEPGWDAAAWNGYLGTTSAEWDANLASDPTMKTWTSGAGGNETLPITCATWYEHHAFCIWDGGFLPSEAEWNYAAAGGNLQRAYPWGAMDPGANASLAIWRCYYGGNDECAVLISADIAPVGSAAAGNGVYGQLDLAGNVMEWNLDWDADYAKPCDNCANTTSGSRRVLRGGGFSAFMSYLLASSRFNVYPTYRSGDLGARCARTP
jgi:formylglycine-generating enzyme required for sulfatase activity